MHNLRKNKSLHLSMIHFTLFTPKDAKHTLVFVRLDKFVMYFRQNLYVVSNILSSVIVKSFISSQPKRLRGIHTELKRRRRVRRLVVEDVIPEPTIAKKLDLIFCVALSIRYVFFMVDDRSIPTCLWTVFVNKSVFSLCCSIH